MIDLRRREGRMLHVGHRGAAALAPENTIASLALAVRMKSGTTISLRRRLVLIKRTDMET